MDVNERGQTFESFDGGSDEDYFEEDGMN